MQKEQVPSRGWEDPLEKEMATHFSILAWKIPWTEELGRPQFMGLKKSDMTLWLNSNNEEYDPSKTLSGSYENCSEEVREEASMYVISGKAYMQPNT